MLKGTTSVPKGYSFPDLPPIMFWDLPGAGDGPENPIASYFEDKALFAFDCLIVVSSVRFTEADILIAKQAEAFDVPVFFAHSKFDVDLLNTYRKKHRTQYRGDLVDIDAASPGLASELISSIRTDIQKHLEDAGLKGKIYIMSSPAFLATHQRDSYVVDEQSFAQDILNTALQRRTRSAADQ